MNNAWTVEFSRILIVVVTVILCGLATGYWTLAILLPTSVYLGWTLAQIRSFERWIRLGAKTKWAPDSSGIWQLIVQHIYRIQKKNAERKKKLGKMATRFEATISALPEATVVLNHLHEIEWVNDAAKSALGIDKEKDLGQRLDNLVRLPELSNLLQQDQLTIEEQGENQIEIASPIDAQKTLIVTCTDFGEKQKLVTARDVSQRIAVQKLRKAFIANASHELRTPLTVISGYLEMLESEDEIPVPLRTQVSNANQQALRMKKILDDLLTLSKLEEKGCDKDSGDVINVPELLKALVTDFRKTRAKDTHQIKVAIDESIRLKALDNEFYSLCQNLINNAIKYSTEGAEINIIWRKNANGEGASLSVVDNGEGIAPEHISRLTERFYRVNINRSRQVGGTGLGLSIVKHILENHGGNLRISSELGKGSEFVACFPGYRVVEKTACKNVS